MKEKSDFELLHNKKILLILNGDTNFGVFDSHRLDDGVSISMPYLSGPDLCEISNKFGLPVIYGEGGIQSRWRYLDDLLVHCIQNGKVSDLLAFIFSKSQFADKLKGQTVEEIEHMYHQIKDIVITQINNILYFSDSKLVENGNTFLIRRVEDATKVATPNIKVVDRSYIKDLSNRAINDIADGNYDSAITKSRTLLEEVFCYAIEKKNQEPLENGDIIKLYNQVKQLYKMHQNKDLDKRINGLLAGLEKIISAIAEMRNKNSDSHGVGAKRINISDYHARLFVNSSMTVADFILAVSEKAS